MTGSGKDIITIAPVTQPAGASPPSQATSLTYSTPGAATPTTTVPAAIYSAPPSAYGAPPSPSASRAARAVVGVAALAVVANNVDWEDKYVINTPGGAVVVDEDDLEDIQENYHRPSAQPTATGTSSRASPSIATTAAKPTTQPAGQPAPSTKPAVTPWQPNPSHMASGGAPQPSTANQSAAARGWSQPSTSLTGQPRTSPAAASSRASNAYTGGWARPSEGIRARAYSGRGATSRSGGTRGR
jgi:hypothetical protein